MSDVSGDGPQLGGGDRPLDWRARYDAARARGIPLDPRSEPVAGVNAYPTAYDASHLLVTETDRLEEVLGQLRIAAADFGWGIELERVSGEAESIDAAVARARAGRDRFGLPTVYRVRIFPAPRPDRDDEPVPPIDAWRLLQRARARFGRDFPGVALDHVLTVDPLQVNPYGKTNPFGKTNPYGKTNPFGKTNAPGVESYADPGSGGRQVVGYVGPAPQRRALPEGGRRPVVAVLDTGCGAHPWLPDDVVDRHPAVDGTPIGVTDPATDPELHGDVSGPFDGGIDEAAGHGTFIAGVVRQVCPDADIVSVRVADSQGTVLESEFMVAVRSIVKWMSLPPEEGGRAIDVLNLSLSYYHETPEDELFDRTLSELLVAARRLGCVVVCSAGNEATDRPTFPASLWAWPHADFVVDDPADAAPHLSVGALNPNGTMALFSNIGPWVRTCAPGVAVLSTSPPFEGGVEPGSRDDRWGIRRETIDPDDFSGGFALWSGTSFAAPFVAALFARALADPLADGELADARARVAAVKQAEETILGELAGLGPRVVTG